MSIQNIVDVFYARLTGDNGAGGVANATGGVGSRIYPEEGKQNATMPHLVFSVIASTPEYLYSARTEQVSFQVDIYCDKQLGTDVARDIDDKVFTLFNEATFATAPTGYDRAKSRVTQRGVTTIEEDTIRVMSEITVLATDF